MKVISRIYLYDDRLKNIIPFALQLAHFRNMLILLIHKLKDYLNYHLTNESLLYSLLADKLNLAKTKDKSKVEKLNNLLNIINSNEFLAKLLKDLKEFKKSFKNNYAIQSTIRQTCKNFKSYRKAYEKYLKEPSKFNGIPKPPKPKKLKNIDKFTVDLNKLSFKVIGNVLHITLHKTKKVKVKLPKFIQKPSSVRVTYYLNFAYIDLVYDKIINVVYDKIINVLKPVGCNKAGIDLGVENFATIVSNSESNTSLVIKSSQLKSFNQWYNKLLAGLKSELDLIKNQLKEDSGNKELKNKMFELVRRIRILHLHRKKWMSNVAHQISKSIAVYLHATGHDTVFVGYNILDAKNGSKMSKKVNQSFIQIPFRTFIEKLKYKLEWFGIQLKEVDEGWTSKASCISDDIINIQRKFKKLLKTDNNEETKINFFILTSI